jgi:hypothetical protein
LSAHNPFDIHGFDATLLNIEQIKQALATAQTDGGDTAEWQVTHYYAGNDADIYRLDPDDNDRFPVLCAKQFHNADHAEREYAVLDAIHDFGFSIGPRPFYNDDILLLTEWLHGEVLQAPPHTNDDAQWHRIMAMLGVPWNMPFMKYASRVAMRGTGPQSPGDVFPMLDAELATLDANHTDYPLLANLIERVKERVVPEWNSPSVITLNHLDPCVHHFLWDGAHMRLVGWHYADWCDKAYAVGQLCAHPEYVHLSTQHWVWYRWELSRLDRDPTLRARATTYTNLLLVRWAVRFTAALASIVQNDTDHYTALQRQRDEYLHRATSAFA